MTAPDTATIRAQMEALIDLHVCVDMAKTAITLCDTQDAGAAREAALRAEVERLREALHEISVGEGIYGAQAAEYKAIARAALAQGDR